MKAKPAASGALVTSLKSGWFGIWLNLGLAVFTLITAALCVFLLKGETEPASGPASGNSVILEIRDTGSGIIYGKWPLEENGEFAVEFIHSVHQSPVRETFKVTGKEIQPVSARFYSFGAGMQADVEEGQIMSRDGDALVITGFNRAFTELNYILGTVSDHLLFINGEIISLRNLCGKNAHITLRIR